METNKGGIYNQIKNNNVVPFTFVGGEFEVLSLKKSILESVGDKLTEEEERRFNELLHNVELREKEEKEVFLRKWGEDTVKLHDFLDEKFGTPMKSGFYNNHKTWKVNSWLDIAEMSESIELDWYNGKYSLIFQSGDGYNNKIVIKDNITDEYIYNCINNWT